MRYRLTPRLQFARLCISGALAVSCSDFFGDVPDPGAAGPVEGGPRSLGNGGSGNGSGGSFNKGGSNNGCDQPPCPNNGVGGSGGNVNPVSKSTVLAGGLNVQSLALDDQYVYAASDQGLVRVPKNGGQLLPIGILQQGGPSGIAVDATSVYYVTNSGAIQSVPKGGGPPTDVVPGGMGAGNGSLILDGDTFYYTVGPSLRRAPVSGGAFTEIASMVQQNNNQPNHLAVDPTYVYFLSFPNAQTTMSLSAVLKTGGPTQGVGSAKGTIGALAAANGGVAFTDVYAFGGTKLDLNVSMVGGPTVNLTTITFTGGNPDVGGALALDAANVRAYFSGSPGLMRYQDGGIQTLDPVVQPHVIVLDDTDVYFGDWSSSGGPNPTQPGIKKIAK